MRKIVGINRLQIEVVIETHAHHAKLIDAILRLLPHFLSSAEQLLRVILFQQGFLYLEDAQDVDDVLPEELLDVLLEDLVG